MRRQRHQGHRLGRLCGDVVVGDPYVILRTRRTRFARQRLLQQDDIDVGVGVEGFETRHEGVGAAQHGEAAVDRVSDQRAHRQHGLKLRHRCRRERRKAEPVALRGIEQKATKRARQGHGAEPPSGNAPGMDQEFGDFDGIVEGFGPDDAEFTAHRVEGLGRSGERSRVRHGGLPPCLRLAELDGDDRLAGRPGDFAGPRKPGNVGDRLHIDDDDFELRLASEERDVIGDGQTGFVPARDQIPDGARAAKNKAERANAAVEAIKTGATNAAAAAKEAAGIFDDLAALRKASNVTVKRKVERVPIRIVMKPKNMFFRAHPSDDMSLLSSLVHDESEDGSGTGHLYYIVPAMRSHPVLAPRLKFFMITAIITRANVVMLFPVPIAWPPGVKDYASWQALQDIVRRTKEGEWLSFAWLEDARNYQVTAARGEIDEPKWPEGTLADG
jgi:hypothetical protein